jgi:hypothetical protein
VIKKGYKQKFLLEIQKNYKVDWKIENKDFLVGLVYHSLTSEIKTGIQLKNLKRCLKK